MSFFGYSKQINRWNFNCLLNPCLTGFSLDSFKISVRQLKD